VQAGRYGWLNYQQSSTAEHLEEKPKAILMVALYLSLMFFFYRGDYMPHKNTLRMIHGPVKGPYRTGANLIFFVRRGHNVVERSNFAYDGTYGNRISVVIGDVDWKEAKEKF